MPEGGVGSRGVLCAAAHPATTGSRIIMTFDTLFLDNSLRTWALAAGIALVTWIVLVAARRIIIAQVVRLSRKTTNQLDDLVAEVLRAIRAWFLLGIALYAGSNALTLPSAVHANLLTALVLVALLQAGMSASAGTRFFLEHYKKERLQDDPGAATMVGAMSFLVRMVLWAAVLLLALDNLGIDITALVAGLGVGGVAVALAAQNILGDLFASLAIVLDKPFVLGDFIIVGDMMGTVEHIGLKTTRLRSLGGEQLIFSNADLLSSRVRNYKRMFERRVVFTLGVTYQTPRDKLRLIPGIIRDAITAQEKTRFDRSHLSAYGAYAIDFETAWYVLDPDYGVYMEIQQAVYLEIHERFEAEGIEFAYPTQTIFVERGATDRS